MGEADEMELIYSLVGYPSETEWIEFKSNNAEPKRIAQDISALANSAALHARDFAYKLWGVDDKTHALVGTTFDPLVAKGQGNQPLAIWLRTQLTPNADYEFKTIERDGLRFVVLTIRAAIGQPVAYENAAYIREGSSTTRLMAGSAKEARLWKRLQQGDFESGVAEADLTLEEAVRALSAEAYYDLLHVRQPTDAVAIAREFVEQGLLAQQDNGRYAVTNLGALVVGKSLTACPGLRKRPLRVIRYEGTGSFNILDDQIFDKGYAMALMEAERYIMTVLPSREVVQGAIRRIETAYPQRAVRELLSNAVIHQDLGDVNAGPVVCIYDNRIEFANPGTTLIPVERVLNALPRTRNERLASLLRQMDLCEEGGTGWDLAVASCEDMQLPAPAMRSEETLGTVVTLFADGEYRRLTKAERRDAVYWHACLMYAQGTSMSNRSLRERFGIEDTRQGTVAISRLIRDCLDAGLIKDEDEEAGARYKRYVPYWA